MKKIAITGAKGTIGTVLRKGLTDYKITSLDLPESDVRDYEKLLKILPNHDVIIHLAWDTKTENFLSGKINPDNIRMTYNVYEAAKESGVSRVIMASSVHADKPPNWRELDMLSPNRVPMPDSPYGASKNFMESLGRYYATKGLEVVCIRFGGIGSKPSPYDYYEKGIWLSHKDCVGLVKKCIDADKIPNNFFIVYGISNSKKRFYDYSNPINWEPQDCADDIL